ncbi:cysteine desulfurase/selenocysteine lyase [Rhodococcus sp. 27YEA15]|uniref:aminotransferase class V-fold PLP-dependent enzyme n=1 Tax=Rhodococcus sp. 27YEA15 TaxID=3156259 RepID=UPI003C7A0895
MALLDNSGIRDQFPAADNTLYLDSAHQTPLSRLVRAELDRFYDSALTLAGPKYLWLERVEQVRAKLATFLSVAPEQIAFTKNTSEGLNICANGVQWEPGDNVLLLEGEHPNNAYAWLSKRSAGLEVRLVPNDKKWADADTFASYIDDRTRAIGISHVMFHSGQRNDVASITAATADRGIAVVADSMQSVGVIPLDVPTLGIAALASGSHKGLLTPQGLGFLWTAADTDRLTPTYVGTAGIANARPDLVATADPIELRANSHRFEIGNFNLPAIHALGAALDLIESVGVANIEEHTHELGDQLIEIADSLGVGLVGPRAREHRSPHIYVLDLTQPELPASLAENNARVSPVRDGIRVSFGMYNTSDDVTRFGELLATALKTAPATAGVS